MAFFVKLCEVTEVKNVELGISGFIKLINSYSCILIIVLVSFVMRSIYYYYIVIAIPLFVLNLRQYF